MSFRGASQLQRAVVLFAISVSTPFAAVAQLCPPCYTDQQPLAGQGAAPDGSGRRVLYIKIDTASWGGTPLPANIVQGTQNAADMWNAKQTCYYFQVITSGTPDYLITSSTAPNGGCADDNISGYPYNIELWNSLQSQTYSASRIGSLIAHELGHGIGLDNADDGCVKGASIMSGYFGTGCQMVTSGPTASDVAKTNQNCNNRSTCDRSKESTVGAPQTTSCPEAQTCPDEGNAYLADGPADPCQNSGNGCANSEDAFFSNVGCCYETQSPIIIDLQRSGFQLTDATDGVSFDFSGSGVPSLVSWLALGSGNAWLALDRNGNGKIDSGKELFGNYTPQPLSSNPNGFAALAVFDKRENGGNEDGIIDEHDSVFTRLRLWT